MDESNFRSHTSVQLILGRALDNPSSRDRSPYLLIEDPRRVACGTIFIYLGEVQGSAT
jgi:hypothetical protein